MPAQLFVGPYAPSGKKTIVAMVARASLVPIMGSAWRRTRARMIWNDLEAAAPEIAQLGKECFERARVALLGTLRRDGSPRISPVEPYLVHGQLLFGAMSWSLKPRDLLRDPRCALHSAIANPDSGEGELKLYGRAGEADDPIRESCQEGGWRARPLEAAGAFSRQIGQPTCVSWATDQGGVTARSGSPLRGLVKP